MYKTNEEIVMKRNKQIAGIITAAMVAVTLMAGCGANPTEDSTEKEAESAVESVAEKEENVSESESVSEAESAAPVLSGSSYDDVENGTAKVKYTGKGDVPGYLELSQVLTVGESYTISEICEALKQIVDFQDEPEITYSMIDCGSDGEEELLVEAQLSAAYGLDMIIKNIDGEFVICYDQNATERSYISVNTDGTIESGGSSAANIHSMDYAFVDANGEYKFFYGVTETLSVFDTYDIYVGDSVTSISAEGIDAEHMAVLEYYFEENYEERNSFYSFYTFDDSYNEVDTEEGRADIAEFGVRFKDAGYLIYDQDGINAVLKDRAEEIGYPGQL